MPVKSPLQSIQVFIVPEPPRVLFFPSTAFLSTCLIANGNVDQLINVVSRGLSTLYGATNGHALISHS